MEITLLKLGKNLVRRTRRAGGEAQAEGFLARLGGAGEAETFKEARHPYELVDRGYGNTGHRRRRALRRRCRCECYP